MSSRANIFIPIGAAAGIAMAFGRLPYFAGAASDMARTSATLTAHLSTWTVHRVSHQPGRTVVTVTVALSLMSPGIAAALLALAAYAGTGLRRGIGVAIVALGVAAFFFLPGTHAAGVFGLCLVLGVCALIGLDVLVSVPCAAVATMLAVTWGRAVLASHTLPGLNHVATINDLWFNHAADPLSAKIAVVSMAGLPFLVAIVLLIRGTSAPARI